MYALAVELMSNVYTEALPIAIFIALADLCVVTFIRCAFGGSLWLKS